MRTRTIRTPNTRVALCAWLMFSSIASADSGIIQDIQLTQSSHLQGKLVSANGGSISNAVVQLRYQGQPVAAVRTGPQGNFTVSGVRAGAHEVVSGAVQQPVRLWTHGSAPQGANSTMMMASHPASSSCQTCPTLGPTGCVDGCQAYCGPVSDSGVVVTTGGMGMLDLITLTTMGTSIGALAVGVSNYESNRKISRQISTLVSSQAGNAPASP